MPTVKNGEGANGLSRIVDAARKEQERREKTYREKALKIYPWICGRCGREFSGKRLRELTVHHRDHNHDNNPPDGSNWELLCLYCHDNEHARQQVAESYGTSDREDASASSTINQPFAALDALLKKMK